MSCFHSLPPPTLTCPFAFEYDALPAPSRLNRRDALISPGR
jgi:hypothetical protein